MNERVLYQWAPEIAAHLPRLNSWQRANVALMSDGVLKAEGCQQQKVAAHAGRRTGGQCGAADTAVSEQFTVE